MEQEVIIRMLGKLFQVRVIIEGEGWILVRFYDRNGRLQENEQVIHRSEFKIVADAGWSL